MTQIGGTPCFAGGVPLNGNGGNGCSTVGFDADRSTNQTISTAGTGVKIDWNVVANDPGGDFSLASDYFVAPVEGRYTFTCNGKLITAAAGFCYLQFWLNGSSTTGTLITEQGARAPSAATIAPNAARVIWLSANNTVEVWVLNTTGFNATWQGCQNHFSGALICAA